MDSPAAGPRLVRRLFDCGEPRRGYSEDLAALKGNAPARASVPACLAVDGSLADPRRVGPLTDARAEALVAAVVPLLPLFWGDAVFPVGRVWRVFLKAA